MPKSPKFNKIKVMAINKLNSLRTKIDIIDGKTAALLEKRFLLLEKIRPLKKKIKNTTREKKIAANIKKNIRNKTIEPYALKLFTYLMKLSVDYQKKL
ncbi:MAG: chorismate mutase [Elusimicrobiales bacterium]|nr:chorismate mutase [Elusimicrobiales bacterium]